MITRELIVSLQQQGVQFEVAGSNVKIKAPLGVLQPQTRNLLSENKSALIRLLSRHDDNLHYWHSYNERASLHEHEGKLPQSEAEWLAYASTLVEYCQEFYQEVVAEFEAAIYQPTMN